MPFDPQELKDARKRYGHTQVQAAASLEIAPSVWARWEQGVHKPRGLYAKAVAAYIRASRRRQ